MSRRKIVSLDGGRIAGYGHAIGFSIWLHRHGLVCDKGLAGHGDCPAHLDIELTLIRWYVCLTFGRSDPDE